MKKLDLLLGMNVGCAFACITLAIAVAFVLR